MKTIYLISLLLAGALQLTKAQTPAWSWAMNAQGYGHDYGQSISIDALGNSYVTGYFQTPQIIFDSDTLNASSSFNSDFFIAKLDTAGNTLWARTSGGPVSASGMGIKADAAGNTFIAGSYQNSGTIIFGNITLISPSGSLPQAFIVKYDSAGNALWAHNAGEVNWGAPNNFSIDIDSYGNAYMTGVFADSTYAIKYDTAGNELWRKKYSGSIINTFFWNIAVDDYGFSFIAGYFSNTALAFDTITIPNTSNGYTIITVKLDSAGNPLWATSQGVTASLYKPDISVDEAGNCYLTGYFNGNTATFGNITLTNAGVNDVFVVKYDNKGNVIWAKRAGGNHYDNGIAIAADSIGNCYVTGFFRGVASFGTINLYSAGEPEIFVAKYDTSGTVVWAKDVDGSNVDAGNDIAVDGNGNCYLTGDFFSPVLIFDNIILQNSNSAFYPAEAFVAKLGNVTTTGVSEVSKNKRFSLNPNPFNSRAMISFNQEQKNIIVRILDFIGREIRKINFSGTTLIIEKSELNNGIYIVEVKTSQWSENVKIIIQD